LRIHLGVRIGFEVIDQPADAPLPGAQRAPVIGFTLTALVRQAYNPRRQLIVIGLDAARIDATVAPPFSYGFLGPGTAGRTAATRPAAKAAKFDHDRHGAIGTGWYREAHLDVYRDLWVGAVVDVTHERFGDRWNAAAVSVAGRGHFPCHLWYVLRN